jgi:N-acetylglucosaminyldiphosphoundecaprenol N-acetyl-beta-D-mannosaminyltransferase
MKKVHVLSCFISQCTFDEVVNSVIDLAKSKKSSYICICNVHSIVESYFSTKFRDVINGSCIATPDGMPVAWFIKRVYKSNQKRVCGPDLMPKILKRAESEGVSVYFYGSSTETLNNLILNTQLKFPDLNIAGYFSPPYAPLDQEQLEQHVNHIKQTKAQIVFVGMGCPKQELLMHKVYRNVPAVFLGVGAAFDFMAGTTSRAPRFMQNYGFEWLFRLFENPRRLFFRYFKTNLVFLFLVGKYFLKISKSNNQ